MRRREVRLGLIGAGPWGRNFIKTIRAMEGVCLARLASGNPKSRDWVDPDCLISADWHAVAEARDLDGVIVATPPDTHIEITRKAVAAGLPVLVEKPLTLDLEEAENLLGFVEERGGFVLVDHIHLFNPVWKALKSHAAELGPVRKIRSIAGAWRPFRKKVPVLWDWGPHDLALCLDLLGRSPSSVFAERSETRKVGEGTGESIRVELEFDDVKADITLSNLLPEKKRSFSAYFDKEILVFDDRAANKLMRHPVQQEAKTETGPGTPLPYKIELPLQCVVRSFIKAIQNRKNNLDSLRLAIQVTRVLDQAQNVLGCDRP